MNIFMFVGMIALICVLGFFNEKVTKLTYEIALMLFSIVIGILLVVTTTLFKGATVLEQAEMLDVEEFLLKGVLCFMLFAGSFRMALSDFKKMARQITVLAFVCTLLGSIFYGLLFYGAALLLGVKLSLPVCLMFGSIVAPTDPIAATGILSKFGLPKNISFLIQGESLFNDGVGVALFVGLHGGGVGDLTLVHAGYTHGVIALFDCVGIKAGAAVGRIGDCSALLGVGGGAVLAGGFPRLPVLHPGLRDRGHRCLHAALFTAQSAQLHCRAQRKQRKCPA